ncbi:peptidoglycan DD-metalloendopeptidase family protein [Fuscibacter oryzae]|uniref:Peptidoglycan DD-metalloendopeptidase family protein n=1 Tax=Fuscibacter oryzae TaxID=2803939 RepID=A0A8J7SQU8_9RHOB|nr:peptidoglycan DD-metalloendopeptidase family protein [Fuscibacter oryzae]MBL4927066.1 peptidoglycan DD-metalloendopeptidase family protein [Fuscibacter oryzae]
MNSIYRELIGKDDLYAALRTLAARVPDMTLAQVLGGLAGGDAAAQAVARRLAQVDLGLLRAVMRVGRGLPASAAEAQVRQHLGRVAVAPVFAPAIADATSIALPTRGERPDMPAFSDHAFDDWFAAQGVSYGLGLYGEKRSIYATAQFADAASSERRMIHLGIDVFAPAGTAVHAPLAGRVRYLTYNADPLDYGHTLILEHEADGVPFYTLYGHLGASLPHILRLGDPVSPGQTIAHLGDWPENGGWAPHLHFQVITDLLAQDQGNFFGVGHESLWELWQSVSPDPNLILRLPPEKFSL